VNEEHYMGLLVEVSLRLVSKDFPLEVQCHGAKMIKVFLNSFICQQCVMSHLHISAGLNA
jgi:hypothetical protein